MLSNSQVLLVIHHMTMQYSQVYAKRPSAYAPNDEIKTGYKLWHHQSQSSNALNNCRRLWPGIHHAASKRMHPSIAHIPNQPRHFQAWIITCLCFSLLILPKPANHLLGLGKRPHALYTNTSSAMRATL